MPFSVNWEKYREDALKLVREKQAIPLMGEICEELEAIVIECLMEANFRDLKKVTLVINSNGGNLSSAHGIANTIRLSKTKVVGVVLSKAKSAAMMILQACSERIACSGATMLMHWGRTNFLNYELDAIMRGEGDWVIRQVIERNEDLVAALMNKSKLTKDQIWEMCRQERNLSAREALEFDLIDRIVPASETFDLWSGVK